MGVVTSPLTLQVANFIWTTFLAFYPKPKYKWHVLDLTSHSVNWFCKPMFLVSLSVLFSFALFWGLLQKHIDKQVKKNLMLMYCIGVLRPTTPERNISDMEGSDMWPAVFHTLCSSKLPRESCFIGAIKQMEWWKMRQMIWLMYIV